MKCFFWSIVPSSVKTLDHIKWCTIHIYIHTWTHPHIPRCSNCPSKTCLSVRCDISHHVPGHYEWGKRKSCDINNKSHDDHMTHFDFTYTTSPTAYSTPSNSHWWHSSYFSPPPSHPPAPPPPPPSHTWPSPGGQLGLSELALLGESTMNGLGDLEMEWSASSKSDSSSLYRMKILPVTKCKI